MIHPAGGRRIDRQSGRPTAGEPGRSSGGGASAAAPCWAAWLEATPLCGPVREVQPAPTAGTGFSEARRQRYPLRRHVIDVNGSLQTLEAERPERVSPEKDHTLGSHATAAEGGTRPVRNVGDGM